MANNMLQSLLFSGGGGSGGGGVLVVHQHESDDGLSFLLDKTWKEIHDAPFAVLNTVSGTGTNYLIILSTGNEEGHYTVKFADFVSGNDRVFKTDNENSYPSRENK